jgi:hypothetical protein
VLAVGTETESEDSSSVLQRLQQGAIGLPKLDGSIAAAGGDELTVWAGINCQNWAGMPRRRWLVAALAELEIATGGWN